MGICINIDRAISEDKSIVYRVTTEDFGGAKFYIRLLPQEKFIYLYSDADLKQLIRFLDVSYPEAVVSVPEIDSGIINRVMMRCLKALYSGHFPQSIGYYA